MIKIVDRSHTLGCMQFVHPIEVFIMYDATIIKHFQSLGKSCVVMVDYILTLDSNSTSVLP